MAKPYAAVRATRGAPGEIAFRKRPSTRQLVLVAAACALAGVALSEESEAGPSSSVELALKALGRDFKVDGVNVMVNVATRGRSQIVRVTTPIKELHYKDNPKSGKLELRKVWCGMALPGPLSEEVAKDLLRENVVVKVGAWQLVGETSIAFEANLGAASTPQMLETVLLATAETCDSKEQELEGKKILPTVDKF